MQDYSMDVDMKSALAMAEFESRQELQESADEVSLDMGAECLAEYEKSMSDFGLTVDLMQAEEAKDLAAAQKWVESVRPALMTAGGEMEVAQRMTADELAEGRDVSLTPEGFTALSPIGFSEISSDSMTQVWLPAGACKDYWVKAWGGGWGCTGGVGSIHRHLTWYFYYTPTSTKFHAINPYVRFNGFYITRANDKWYNCKYARGRVQIKVNAHQYNWKGQQVWTVLDSRGSNINVNRRFDTTRRVNYSALLARRDRVVIQVQVGLYAYAKGGGSYSELNFATGSANRICIPHIWVG